NCFAQAGKCRVHSIVFACDTAPELLTMAPGGMVKVFPRRIDLENTARLKAFDDVTVVESLADLEAALKARQAWLNESYSYPASWRSRASDASPRPCAGNGSTWSLSMRA